MLQQPSEVWWNSKWFPNFEFNDLASHISSRVSPSLSQEVLANGHDDGELLKYLGMAMVMANMQTHTKL